MVCPRCSVENNLEQGYCRSLFADLFVDSVSFRGVDRVTIKRKSKNLNSRALC